MIEERYDEGLHCKEVYAHFGLAFYMASVFEAGLANAILQLDYLAGVAKDYRAKGRADFDRPSYEAQFDIFMANQHAQSLGNLIKRVQALAEMELDLKAQIVQAKESRDFLAHHFFRVRASEFLKREGRDAMIVELIAARTIFERVDDALTVFMEPHLRSLGISKDQLAKYTARIPKEQGLAIDPVQN